LKIDLLNSSWWTLDLNSAGYGSQPMGAVKKAILDTGTSLITLAETDYNLFETKMKEI